MKTSVLVGVLLALSSSDVEALDYKVKGISFSGGGFRAHSVHSGLTAGLTQVLMPQEKDANTKFNNLFKNMDFLTSNSGGSWFASHIVYSQNFIKMISDLAQASDDLEKAADIFYTSFLAKFLDESLIQSSKVFNPNFPYSTNDTSMMSLAEAEGWAGILMDYIYMEPLEWAVFAKNVLEAPGDLDADQSLSAAKINSWAAHKQIVMAGSLVLPSQDPLHASFGAFNKKCQGDNKAEDARTIRYQNAHPHDFGNAIPITFSSHLAPRFRGQESPFPFLSIPKSAKVDVKYSIYGPPSLISMGKVLYELEGKQTKLPGPGMHSHEISIADASGTSSAFQSISLSIFQNMGFLADILADMGLWAMVQGFVMQMAVNPDIQPSEMFRVGAGLVTPHNDSSCDDWINQIVKNQVMATSDGAYVGNTGLGNILAAAKTGDAFTLFLNSDGFDNDIINLFGGLHHHSDSDNFTQFPVFIEPREYAKVKQATFSSLHIVEDSQILRSIHYGVIDATTAHQPFFGITPGKRVRLNCIIVDGDAALAPTTWHEPAAFVAEISASMQLESNRQRVNYILKHFF